MIEDSLSEFPKGWVRTTLGEISGNVGRVNPQFQPNKEFIYLDIASIDNNLQKIIDHKMYLGKDAPSRARQVVKSGDILFSTVRTYLKNIAVVKDIYNGQIASTGFCVIRPLSPVDERLIFWLTLTEDFLNPLNQLQRGTSYPAVRDSDVFSQTIPLPPLPEQHRIVSKIEELFTKLDAGVEALKKVKAQLKRYRQAVLKYAFEGKLTQEWREANKDKLEPASVLLERIKEDRKKKMGEKFKELPALDTSDLPKLPKEWAWCRFGDVIGNISLIGKKLKQSEYQEKGMLPVIDQGQSFIGGYTDKHELKIKVEQPLIIFGDHTKVFKYVDVDFVAGADGIKVLKPEEFYNPKLFYYFAQAISLPEKGYARHFQWLEKSLIPHPPIHEQLKIKDEIESRLSTSDEMEKVVEQTLKQSERLRQSILKMAFEGKLVSQDPTDEPAEKLLERIRSEREKKSNLCKIKHGRTRKALNGNCQIEE